MPFYLRGFEHRYVFEDAQIKMMMVESIAAVILILPTVWGHMRYEEKYAQLKADNEKAAP